VFHNPLNNNWRGFDDSTSPSATSDLLARFRCPIVGVYKQLVSRYFGFDC
jgi:hypothetical protein